MSDAKDDPVEREPQAPDDADVDVIPEGPDEPSAAHVPFFFGGIVLGALLAAAIGLDLSERPRERYIARLEDERRSLSIEVDSLRERFARLESAREPGAGDAVTADLPEAARVSKQIERADRAGLALSLPKLLRSGFKGYDRLLEVLRGAVRRPLDDFRRSPVFLSILVTVARHEDAFVDFLGYALVSPQVQRDRELREWLLKWGTAYASSAPSPRLETARAALQQGLEKELQSADADVWLVLDSLERLRGRAPVDSIRGVLSSEASSGVHGNLLKRLEARGDAEAVRVIVRFIEGRRDNVSGDDSSWLMQLALDALARIAARDAIGETGADVALAAFRGSREPNLQARAEMAFFSVSRASDELPSLVGFLDSSAPLAFKISVARNTRLRSPELFAALRDRESSLADQTVREAINEADDEANVVPAKFSGEARR